MIPNVPWALPDQCIDSLATVFWLKNGDSQPLRSALNRSFGIQRPIRSAVGGGGRQLEAMSIVGYASPLEFLAAHSYLPLFKPFAAPTAYAVACESLVAGRANLVSRQLAAFDTARVRPSRWYCEECARLDLSVRGYAYARRVHQVVGVDACPMHGLALLRPRLKKDAVWSEFGVILSLAELANPIATTDRNTGTNEERAVRARFGHFVCAALTGSLASLGPRQRRALIAERLCSTPRQPGEPRSLPHRFETMVSSIAPREWLAQLGFDPRAGGSQSSWPASFVAGIGFQEDPSAGLISAAVLFKDPEEYNREALRHAGTDPGYVTVGDSRLPARGRSVVTLTPTLIRALMHSTKEKVARDFSLAPRIVDGLMDLYPGLRERRERVGLRKGLKRYRDVILRYVREHGVNSTRRGALHADGTAYKWVRAHDPEFLETVLPRRSGRMPRTGVATKRLPKRSRQRTRVQQRASLAL